MSAEQSSSPQQNTQHNNFKGYALVILAATFWGLGGLLAKWLFTDPSAATAGWLVPPLGVAVSPQELAAGRSLLSLIILVPFMLVFKRSRLRAPLKRMPLFAAFGIPGLAMVHFTYFKTISLTNASTAILIEYLAPIIVFIYAVVFQKQKSGWRLPVGIALSLTGCMFVVGAFSPGGFIVSPTGIAWGLGSAVAFATYSLLGNRLSRDFSAWTSLFYGLFFASLFWVVILGPREAFGLLANPKTFLALAAMAVVSTIIPFACFLQALKTIRTAQATMTSMIEPLVVALGELVFFNSVLTLPEVFGGICVISAIILIQTGSDDKRPPRRSHRPIPPPD